MDKDMTQEQKSAKAWDEYLEERTFHSTSPAVSGFVISEEDAHDLIKDFQQALIKRIDEMAMERDYPHLFSGMEIIQLIKETEPIKQ
jgi:hypothetical protein